MLSVFAALLQLSVTSPATATDPPAARPMITNPDWAASPVDYVDVSVIFSPAGPARIGSLQSIRRT